MERVRDSLCATRRTINTSLNLKLIILCVFNIIHFGLEEDVNGHCLTIDGFCPGKSLGNALLRSTTFCNYLTSQIILLCKGCTIQIYDGLV